jgi:hypothetical protein
MSGPIAKTRGGLLVGLIVLGGVLNELRTVLAWLFGIHIPSGQYVLGLLLVLVTVAVVAELSRSTVSENRN